MAKMLGQDILTQEEFDNFMSNDYAKANTKLEETKLLAESARSVGQSASSSASIAIICAAISILMSSFNLALSLGFLKF